MRTDIRQLYADHRRHGKTLLLMAMIRVALDSGETVVVATPDQGDLLPRLAGEFPGALFELVGTWGIKIHDRREHAALCRM